MNHNTTVKAVITGLGMAAATLVLVGCSNGGGTPDKRPTAVASPKAASVEYGKCVDGSLTVFANETAESGAVPVDDCASIAIVGTSKSGVSYAVGKTDKLVIEGSRLTVSVESAGTITIPGSDNTVKHGGEAKVEDLGAGNTVTQG